MKIKVFGMTNCSGCDTVKTLFELNSIDFEYVDVMNPEHMAEAQEYGVRSVPSTFISYGEGEEKFIVGSTQQALKQIREAVGI